MTSHSTAQIDSGAQQAPGHASVPAVVLACRSQERGGSLLAALTAEAQAQGIATLQLEVNNQPSEQRIQPGARPASL